MPPNQQSQYDFILSSNNQPRRSFKLGGGKGARIAVIVGGIILLIILASVANSILSSGDKAQTQRLTEVVQTQAEIIRVSTLAEKKSKNIDTINFAINTKLSVQSSQQQIKKSLVSRGVKDKKISKTLGAKKNSKTDTILDEASKNNRFDETFATVLNKQLTDYQKLLKAAKASAKPKEKKAITASFDNVTRLTPKKPIAPTHTGAPSDPAADDTSDPSLTE